MRRTSSALLSVALVPAALVVPVLGTGAARPHPVAAHVTTLKVALGAVAGPRALSARSTTLTSAVQPTSGFSTFGASWQGKSASTVQVRVRAAASGTWSGWTDLDPADAGPDPGSADAVRAGTRVASEPVWAGPSDAVQTRVVGRDGAPAAAPKDLSLELVDPGTSAADASTGATTVGGANSEAATGQPQIFTRAQWGADESLRLHACPGGPSYSSTIKVGFVHHTVNSNSYSSAEVPALLRGMYAYHVQGNGWCDIGYNFLVDRFGRLWEGRYGGMDRPVIGSHTGGFNRDSFAVSMIGDFSSATPNSFMQQAIAQLMAWKLGSYYRDPLGTDTLTYAGGGYRFCGSHECAAGSSVTLNVISGHRDADVGHTACPGNAGEAILPSLRNATVAAMGGGLVAPTLSATSHRTGDGGAFTVNAGAVTSEPYTLTATDGAGQVVRTVAGSATRATGVHVAWDGTTDAGTPAAAGPYTLKVVAGQGIPFTQPVTLHAPVELTGPSQVGYAQAAIVSGSTYPGSSVTILQAPAGATAYTIVATVPTDAAGNFSYTWPVTSALQTYAQVGPNISGVVTTQVGPSIAGPAVAVPGSLVTLTGTAPPGSAVAVWLQAAPAPATQISTLTAGSDGGWTTTFTADQTYTWWAVANGLQSPTGSTSITAPPTMTGPAQVPLHAAVLLQGSAPAGAQVTVWRKERGRTAYVAAATVAASATGAFSWSYPADDDFRWYASTSGGQSPAGLTQVGVTAHAPAKVDKGTMVDVTGTTLPGTEVDLWRAHVGSASYTKVAVVHARTDGTWSAPLTVSSSWQWYAISRGWRSPTGSTLVASAPLISGPATASYDATVHVTGRATPGDTVTLWLHRRGSTGYRAGASAIAGADGRWSTSYTADEDYRWYATSISGRSKSGVTTVKPLAGAVAKASRGAKVALHGYAVPGQVVHVWFKTAGSRRWSLRRTVHTSAAGRWGTAFVLTTRTSWYAESRGVRSGIGTTSPR